MAEPGHGGGKRANNPGPIPKAPDQSYPGHDDDDDDDDDEAIERRRRRRTYDGPGDADCGKVVPLPGVRPAPLAPPRRLPGVGDWHEIPAATLRELLLGLGVNNVRWIFSKWPPRWILDAIEEVQASLDRGWRPNSAGGVLVKSLRDREEIYWAEEGGSEG